MDLCADAEFFRTTLERRYAIAINIDYRRLFVVANSALDDIERFKNYHLQDPAAQLSDAIKRVAYFAKWLLRWKPLHLATASEDDTAGWDALNRGDRALLVNELFAMEFALANLRDYVENDFEISTKKWHELLYNFAYRALSDDALILFFQTLAEVARGDRIVSKPPTS